MHDPRNLDSVTPDDFRRIREVFESALERRADERRAFVEEACGGNTLLVAEVERMLAAEETRHSLLDAPPRAGAPRSVVECASCRAPIEPGHRFCPACGTPTHGSGTAEGRFRAGALFANRFRIVARLGRGGMGEVYRADDLEVGQPVALKFLTAFRSDERARTRLRSEVRLARQISHPNVCRVYDIGESQGELYLSMEYVDGEDLAALLTRIGRLPIDKGIEIARKLCAGLAAAHAKGVLHRDFKPANIMIDSHGEVRIMDFGLAAIATELEAKDVRSGTPAYMAPEQLAGKEATKQSDLYALGLVLYELFTGKPPFDAKTAQEYLRLREDSHPTKPSTLIPELGERVERAILRCLDADPKQRPQSALEVATTLPGGDPLAEAIAAGETPSPDIVASAGDVGAISPLAGALYLGAIVAALLAIVWLSHRSTLTSFVKIEKSADALVERARQIAEGLGYVQRPVNVEYRFVSNNGYLRYVEEQDASPSRWEVLRKERPSAVRFWYRQSSRRVPQTLENVGSEPEVIAGTLAIVTDPRGRLEQLIVAADRDRPTVSGGPDTAATTTGVTVAEPNWTALFDYAGLSIERFTSTPSRRPPPVYADGRAAWEGAFPERPEIPIRIEAAPVGDRPVYFAIDTPEAASKPADLTVPPTGYVIFFVVLLVAGMALARRNVRLGRGDRRGAARLSIVVGVAVFVFIALIAPDLSFALPLPLMMGGGLAAAAAATSAVYYWVLYIALEPHVRRVWPEILIGWTRLVAGRFRDPLVGKEIVVGILGGAITAAIPHLSVVIPQWLGRPSNRVFWDAFAGIAMLSMNGGRQAAAIPLLALVYGTGWGVGAILTLFLLTVLLRTRGRAIAFYVFVLPLLNPLFGGSAEGMVASGLIFAIGLFLIVRVGALSFMVSAFVWPLLVSVSFDTSAAYATSWYFVFALLGALALYGLHTALAGRSLLDTGMLREAEGRA